MEYKLFKINLEISEIEENKRNSIQLDTIIFLS